MDSSGEDSDPPTCRKYIMGIKIDFMPADESVLGYGNPWFKHGLKNTIQVDLEGTIVSIFKIEHFVATKLKAFNDRGVTGDIRFSQDLEDLTELIDGATKFESEILTADAEVKKFIIIEFEKFLAGRDEYQEAMYGYLNYDDAATLERESAIARIWEQLSEAINNIVNNITLKDLVEWQTEQISQYVI